METYFEQIAGVCGGRLVLKGTRLEPTFLAAFGPVEETAEAFDLTVDQVDACHRFAAERAKSAE